PIATHTEHGTCGLEQIRLLQELGVPPANVIICHMDRNPDIGLHKELASTGCYLEYDNATRIKYHPDSAGIALIRAMVEAGYGNRLLLGTDFALRSYWKAYGGGPGMAQLLAQFVPRLIREGVPQEAVNDMLTSNAQEAYSIRTIGGSLNRHQAHGANADMVNDSIEGGISL